jgi:hypothetical protein
MDRVAKILIVLLLAIIAYKLPFHETTVLAAPIRQTSYSYRFEDLTPNCKFDWSAIQRDLNDGYEILNMAGAPGGNTCANEYAVILRKPN